MMAAISSAENKNEVVILEKNESLGKKLLITGKGRCNITNSCDIQGFMENIPEGYKFLYSSFSKFNNQDIISFLNKQGVATKIERGGRVFPVSDKSQDVLNALIKRIKELNIKIVTNFIAKKILVKDNTAIGIEGENKEKLFADRIIIATGGLSYKVTGSTGDGYIMAKSLGHTIKDIKPSLVPIICEEKSKEICQRMQGLSLRNVKITVKNENKVIYEDFGEMLFTHYGLSGPIILSLSAILIRQ